jgi:hypothetical protein
MPPAAWLFIVLLATILAVVVFTWQRERARTEALHRVADAAGLTFQPKADLAAVRSLGDVQLFSRGHSQRVSCLMTGRIGDQQGAVFDYWYTTGAGKHQSTHAQTVVLLPSAKTSLPDVQMAPENPLYKIAEAFGYQDIDIEASPEFSRRYIVKGADEAAIRAALHPGATSYFAAHEGWTVEVLSGTVAIYRAGSRPKPEDLRAFIEDACAAVRSL